MAGLEQAQYNDQASDKGGEKHAANLPNLVDLHKEDNFSLSKSNLLQAQEQMVMPLNNYLTLRDSQEDDQSYFKAGIALATRAGRHLIGAEDASSQFDNARKQGNAAGMLSLEHADHEQREMENKIGGYGAAALKTALLFAGGKAAFAGLAAVSMTDEARPADPFPRQVLDAALGAGKGLAMKYAFNQITEQSWNPIVKGWTLGMSNRLIDVGLSSNTYGNAVGGFDQDSLKAGGVKTLASVFSPKSLIVDAATGLAAGAVLEPIDIYSGGKFFSMVPAQRLTLAGVSGLTEGSLRELNKQQYDPRQAQINWLEVAQKGLQKGTIDTLSALPSSGIIK
jgi:hypothetical protein